jgi:hypothetical protein
MIYFRPYTSASDWTLMNFKPWLLLSKSLRRFRDFRCQAYSQNPYDIDKDELEAMALGRFFDERKYLLYCLSTIAGAVEQGSLHPKVEEVASQFNTRLWKEGQLAKLAIEYLQVPSLKSH